MNQETAPSPDDGGDDSQPPATMTGQAISAPINPALSTSQHEIEDPDREPPRPEPPSPSSSSSSSWLSAIDDRTELQKFIQDNEKEDSASLNEILNRSGEDQIHQRSHYAGDQNAMHMAADRGLLWLVRQLLEYKPKDKSILSETDGLKRQPLHLACLGGHKGIAELLLEYGADIEARQSSDGTPLDEACWKGHTDVVELLLSKGANTEVVDDNGWSPIRSATSYNRKDIVEKILEKNPAVAKMSDGVGETPLHAASRKGYVELVPLLLKESDIDQVDDDGQTPLYAASRNGWEVVVALLINGKADTNKADNYGETPLHVASRKGHNNIVDLLLENLAEINKADVDQVTPLHAASRNGHVGAVTLLLEHKAKVNVTDHHGRTPIMLASRNGHDVCVKSLCEAGANSNLQANDEEGGKTALHYAFEPAEDEPDISDEKPLQHNVVLELLQGKADPGIQNKKGETVLHLAARTSNFGTYKVILKSMKSMKGGRNKLKNGEGDTALSLALKTRPADMLKLMIDEGSAKLFDSDDELEALMWAAQHEGNHHYAEFVFKNRKRPRHAVPLKNTDNWSAVQWAAHLEMPSVLWLLLATSQALETQNARRSVLKELEDSSTRPGYLQKEVTGLQGIPLADMSARRETQTEGKGEEDEGGTDRDMEKQKPRSTEPKPKDLVLAILRNPPPTITSGKKEKLEQPTLDTKEKELLKDWVSKAAVIDYSVKDDKSTLFTQFRDVQDVIYGIGPTSIAEEPANTLKRMKEMKTTNSSGVYQKICELQEERLGKSQFTWINLPATNVTWMNDLLKRILKDELAKGNDLAKANSFFKASWSEIPDKTSESRIMKPLCYTERILPANTNTGPGPRGKDPEFGADTPDSFLHAIYIPYLTLSRQRRGQDLDGNDSGGAKQQKEGENRREENDGRDQEEVNLHKAYYEYHRLLQCYQDKVVHGSATLDESFYHFCRSQQTSDRPQTQKGEEAARRKDRERRNETQVVTKNIHPEGVEEKSYWTLVRVNQLWVWIIGHKWLITATTHPIDQFEDPFLTDVLGHIEKRARAEGREVKSRSPLEMAKTIVDYCIDAYDRKQPRAYGTDHSIRQIFSDSINKIAREDARLFEDFCDRIEAKQPKMEGKVGVEEDKAPKEKDKLPEKENEATKPERIEEAIKAAARLSAEIRDIRDELQMLQAIAKHQTRVQKEMKNESSADFKLWENYVMSDIADMIESADRIKSNVEMTLSLEQSQIANNQAKESVRQGKVANKQADESVRQGKTANEQVDESIKQGQTLMMFTAITAFFLPSSFLSSLFALDIDSFRQAPYWAFLVIFIVSAALALSFLYFFWTRQRNRLDCAACKAKYERKKKFMESKDGHHRHVGSILVPWPPSRKKEDPSEV